MPWQVPTRLALAFYSFKPSAGFFPRVSRPLEGAAAVVHCKAAACARWCAASAAAAAGPPYQLLIASKADEDAGAAGVRVLRGPAACAAALGARTCPFAADYEGGEQAGALSAAPRPRAASEEAFRPTLKPAANFDLELAGMKW